MIDNIIPYKIKNLYLSILNLLYTISNNNFETLYIDKKIYTNHLYKNLIKIYLSNTNCLSSKYFTKMCRHEYLLKFKYIYTTISLLINCIDTLSWTNVFLKLDYLTIFYDNYNLILNKNNKILHILFSDDIDLKIRLIVSNPFYIYRYLLLDLDIITWTKKIENMFYMIYKNIHACDYIIQFGKFISLLYNIKIQDINDISYLQFVSYCNTYPSLILENNKINNEIKKYLFPINIHINLGILLKHITYFNININIT